MKSKLKQDFINALDRLEEIDNNKIKEYNLEERKQTVLNLITFLEFFYQSFFKGMSPNKLNNYKAIVNIYSKNDKEKEKIIRIYNKLRGEALQLKEALKEMK